MCFAVSEVYTQVGKLLMLTYFTKKIKNVVGH